MPPYKNRKQAFRRKKKFYKAGTTKKPTFRQVRPYGIKPDPFPQRLNTRVKYCYSGTLTSHASTPRWTGSEQIFRLSSIYDCNYTLAAQQSVVGWSMFDSIYKGYIVNGAKIEVNFSNPSSDGMVCFCSLNQTSSLATLADKTNYEASLVYSSDVNNTGGQTRKFNFYVKPWSLLGLSKLEWKANKGTHSSALSANPTQDILFRIACSGASTSQTVHASVRIIYYVTFFERAQLVST